MIAQVNFDQIQRNAGLETPNSLGEIIANILPYAFGISGFLLLIYMVTGGLQIMTSQGDPKGIAAGQAKITSAVIGFVIVLVSAGLVTLIGNLLGISIFGELFN